MTRKAPTTAAVRAAANRAAEALLRVAVVLDTPDKNTGLTPWDRVLNSLHGFPRSAVWDDARGGPRSKAWCWTHERAVGACHDAGFGCDGEVLDVKDPTGEAAIARDATEVDIAVVWDQLAVIETATGEILGVLDGYPETREPTEEESKAANDESLESNDGCQSCERIGWWSPTHRTSTVVGKLDRQWRLCRPCYEHVRKVGALPSRRLLQARRDKGTDNPRMKRGEVA